MELFNCLLALAFNLLLQFTSQTFYIIIPIVKKGNDAAPCK